MLELLQYPFMQRALIAGIILAVLLGILGIFAVLRRMAFFGDGIAHASLAGIALALVVGFTPLPVALVFSVAMGILIYYLERKSRLSSDAAIGIIFTASLSVGVVLMSYQQGYQPELMSFLFGNILAIQTVDLVTILVAAAAILTWLAWQFRPLVLTTLDRDGAYLSGIRTTALELGLYVALTVAVVLGVKIVGIVLVSAMLIIPPSIAKTAARSLRSLTVLSIIAAEVTAVGGTVLSYYLNWPTGATIVLVGTALFILTFAVGRGNRR
ncbi:MAG: metal ABC transporter permease [Patescibacteria group bacterium]